MLCCLHIQYDGSILLPTTVPKFFAVRQVGESTIGAYRLNARPTACMAMFPVGGHYNYDFWGLMSCYSDHIYAQTNHVLASLDTLCNK